MAPWMELKESLLPTINSNNQDLQHDLYCPKHDTNILHAYADSDWATCVKTQRSFCGTVIDRNCDVLPIYYDLLIVMFVSIINIYVEQNSQSLFILINIINIIR